VARSETSRMFKTGVNNVLRVRFNFKLCNMYESSRKKYLDLSGAVLDTSSVDEPENVNHASFDTNLFFVVTKNDFSIKLDDVFDFFVLGLFVPFIQPLLSKYVILECVQFQNFWPAKELGSFHQKNFNLYGLGNLDKQIALKPFCLTFTSSIVKSSKNAFKFRIPGVLAKYKNFEELSEVEEKLENLKEVLSDLISFGPEVIFNSL